MKLTVIKKLLAASAAILLVCTELPVYATEVKPKKSTEAVTSTQETTQEETTKERPTKPSTEAPETTEASTETEATTETEASTESSEETTAPSPETPAPAMTEPPATETVSSEPVPDSSEASTEPASTQMAKPKRHKKKSKRKSAGLSPEIVTHKNNDKKHSMAAKFGLFPKKSEKSKLSIQKDSFPAGLTFYGKSLLPVSIAEGEKMVKTVHKAALNTKIRLKDENHIFVSTLTDLDYTVSLPKVLKKLRGYELKGNVLDRYVLAKDVQQDPVDLTFKFEGPSAYDLSDFYTTLLADWDAAAQNAMLTFRNGVKELIPGSPEVTYFFDAGSDQLLSDLKDGSILKAGKVYDFNLQFIKKAPTITNEKADTFSLLGSYTTKYPAPTVEVMANRQQNLIVSTQNMNGQYFAPGARISALTLYKDVTAENGYLPAGTIIDGHHEDALGGGICQTTTTLYNAVLYAELLVNYRSNHSMVSNYVTPSRDAMVYYAGWDHQTDPYDFVFTNNTSDYIMIEAYVVPEDLTITVNIIGHEDHDPGHSVDFLSEILSMTPPKIHNVVDTSLHNSYAPYAKLYYQLSSDSPEPAMTSRLWKIVYQDGQEVSREIFGGTDVYQPQSTTYAVAPGVRVWATCGGSYETCYITLGVAH